jgi:hypothetical protein
MATGSATGANDSIAMSMPAGAAMPAMSRFELVPIRVTDPARVVMWAMGSSSSRALMPRFCSSSLAAGTSMATIGVVFIRPEPVPMGSASRRRACWALVTVDSSAQVTRDTAPVWTMPLAMTSIAPTVMIPPLFKPAKSAGTGASPVTPATQIAVASVRTAGTRPDAMATRVARTTRAAK